MPPVVVCLVRVWLLAELGDCALAGTKKSRHKARLFAALVSVHTT